MVRDYSIRYHEYNSPPPPPISNPFFPLQPQARAGSPAVTAIVSATRNGGVAGAGLGRKRKREELDCVEVSLESRYLLELGDSRFEVVPLLGRGLPHHFSSQVWCLPCTYSAVCCLRG